jgi:putative ABC transport system permease protein
MILRLSADGKQTSDAWQGSGDYRVVSPDYFRTLGMTLLKGRAFDNRDAQSSQRVVIINERVGRMMFAEQDPIGKRLLIGDTKGKPYEIVGVVADIRNWGIEEPPAPEFYLSYQQAPPPFLGLAVRTKGDPTGWIEEVRRAVWAVDPDQPLYNVVTMEQALSDSISKQRFAMLMLGLFAAMAVILSMVGIYGIMSYSVTQRTHEIGVRVALGAKAHDVVRMIVRQGIVLIVIGITTGLAGSFALTRIMASLLYEVKPIDPFVFSTTALMLALVALFACYIPARRATKVDPLVALRYE